MVSLLITWLLLPTLLILLLGIFSEQQMALEPFDGLQREVVIVRGQLYFHPCIMIDLIVSRCSTYGLLLCFTLLHISNGSVSASLVGHVLYSADLMSAICSPHYYLMMHRYIYSRYSSVFLMLYQLYHSLSFSTLNSSSSLYLSVAT